MGCGLLRSRLTRCVPSAARRYYFLKTLHPAAGGGQYLETPNLVKRWLLRAGIQDAHMSAREARMAHPSDPRFRAFAGQGRRLNG